MRRRGLVALACVVSLTILATQVVAPGAPTAFDVAVMPWLQSPPDSITARVMEGVSLTGGPFATSLYAAVLAAAALLRRRLATAVAVVIVVHGGAVLNVALKHLVARPRPELPRIADLSTYAFPSGHAAAATVFGGLVLLLAGRGGAHAARVSAVVAWVALVGASRILLHAHYPSDVVGGVLEGVAWLALATLALDAARVRWRWTHGATP